MALAILFILSSCDSGLSADSYIEWVTDEGNGLHTKLNTDAFAFDVQYKPWEFVWLRQGGSTITREQAEKELSGLQYYTLTISITDQSVDIIKYHAVSPEDIQRNLYYYSYLFQSDIHLIENGKKLPCVLYHFERSGDMKTTRTFELGFENSGPSTGATIIIESDKFSALPVQIKIKKENIPALL